ncbi:hypothetical protein [Sphingomonas mesophila]|uniref:hypothetical protein n=1 Tax=Sphingomonas mesophila TaxID=2303576 RepID=UPI000E5944F6|nr:hypothetical protein [Sphingomonas mesophila]
MNEGVVWVRHRGKSLGTWAGAALVATALALPAVAIAKPERRPPPVSISFDSVSGFTPASTDPRLAAALAARGSAASDFKFTPAAPKGRPSQVRVAIRAKAPALAARSTDSTPAVTALTQASYNLGVAVGWRRFAVTGDIAKTASPAIALGGKESAVVGVNYSLGKKVTGRVSALAERSDATRSPALGTERTYALDVGGAYSLTRNIAVTGGVRYRVDRDRDAALRDDRRDSQAVYVGTAFKF